MKLNHLDLSVPDVQAALTFFEDVFELRCTSNRSSPALVFLTDDDGFVLVLQRARSTDPLVYPDGFHIGFIVADPALVHTRHARFVATGHAVGDVQVNGRGTMFYAHAPGGILVEVSCRAA